MLAIDLAGRTALVTAATSGLGSAIARTLAVAGAHVVVHTRTVRPAVDGLVDELAVIGIGCSTVTGELTDPAAVASMFEPGSGHPAVDVLVNNAGAYPEADLLTMSIEDWRSVIDANMTSTFLCTQAASSVMARGAGGAIVNIGSLSAAFPPVGQSHYAAAKAAVSAFTRASATELAAHGIRVNTVSPGLVDRPGIADSWPQGVARWLARSPIRRLGSPLDVAHACAFLASPLASWITGQELMVDGGMGVAQSF